MCAPWMESVMSGEQTGPVTAGQIQDLFAASPDFSDFLERLAGFAAAALGEPGSVDCTVTMAHGGGAGTVAGSSEQARAMDQIQYDAGDGPCLEAVRTGRVILVPDLSRVSCRSGYLAAVAGCGYGSVLAVPIPVEGDDGAALNFYGRQAGAFGADAMITAAGIAREAAAALALAADMDRQVRIFDAVQVALGSRGVIRRAVQILMDRNNCGQEAAFDMLRRAAVTGNTAMLQIAETVVAGTDTLRRDLF